MKVLLFRIIGAVVGASFGLLACVAVIRVMSGGNALEEGFLLLPGAPIGLLTGAVAGAVAATRAAQRLGAKCISESERGGKRRLILALVMSIPAAFISVAWIAKEAVGSTHPRKLVSFL